MPFFMAEKEAIENGSLYNGTRSVRPMAIEMTSTRSAMAASIAASTLQVNAANVRASATSYTDIHARGAIPTAVPLA